MRVVFDEDIPRAFRTIFEEFGFEVIDVRDEGLRGASDEAIFNFVLKRKALLFTSDLGFVNPLRFNLKNLQGVILNRLPEFLPLSKRLEELRKLLREVDKDSLTGFITVLEPGRVRRRRI